MLTHLRNVHHKKDIYRCGICPISFDFLHKLVAHSNIHKDVESNSISIYNSKGGSIKFNDDELKGSGREHVCTVCGKSFEWIRRLRLHMKRAHSRLECMQSDKVKEDANCNSNVIEGKDVTEFYCDANKQDKDSADNEFCSIDSERNNDRIERLDSHSSVHKERKRDANLAGSNPSSKSDSNNIDGVRKYVCPQCEYWFSTPRGLTMHIWRIHNKTRYDTCAVCGEKFLGQRKLKIHMIKHLSVNSFDCPDCDEKMSSINDFRAHLELHRTGVLCTMCSKPFSDESMLTSHMNQEHEEDIALQSNVERFSCSYCPQKFARKSSFRRHVMFHKDGTELGVMCSVCGTFVSNRLNLSKHMSTSKCRGEHQRQCHKCPQCDKKFLFSTRLIEHVQRVHEGIKPIVCPDCGRRFYCRSGLMYHSRVHTGVLPPRPHICNVCGQAYEKKHFLKYHMAVHNGEARYDIFCLVCSKAFRSVGQLNQHMKKHNDERSYACQICSARFNYPAGLKRHVEIHSEQPICFCQVCGKGFNQPGNMKIHMRTHSGERPYECNVCSQTFPHQGTWKKHLEMHKK